MDGHLIRQNELHLAAILTIEWVSAGVYTGGADYSLKFTYFNTSQIEEPQHLCWLGENERGNRINELALIQPHLDQFND